MSVRNRLPPPATSQEVGRVGAIWRYPVKSMSAEPLETAEVSWHGIAGDRRWAFVRDGLASSGFPWLTIRERPEMRAYTPSFSEPDRPDESVTVVRTPAGEELDVSDPALATELGDGVRLIKQNRGIFDVAPLSLITSQSISAIGSLLGDELDPQRFRPNLLLDAAGDDAYPEDSWVGATLQAGEVVIRIDQRDKRCVAVNIDPETDQRDPAVLRSIAREREANLGVYCSVVRPGRMAVGEPVWRLGSAAA